jgi:uncharacterized protein YkwD
MVVPFMRFVASLVAVLMLLVFSAFVASANAAGGSPRLDRAERGIVRAINRQRAAHGLGAVRASSRLDRAADFHSREMLYGNYFAHPSLNGAPMASRVRRFAHRKSVGETLAMLGGRCRRHMGGRVVSMWMNSGSHRAVLLSSRFKRVGVARRGGRLSGRRACMVTADFASRR